MERIAAKDDPQGCKVSLNEKLEILSSLERIGKKYKFMIMEKELNIAAILKDKPINTRLHDVARNVTLLFQDIDGHENIICSLIDGLTLEYTNEGRMYQYPTGMEVLKPSKEMQDWSKFAWKKGDVLFCGVDNFCIFDKWANNQYTEFYGRYSSQNYSKEYDKLDTECWTKVGSDGTKLAFIKRIEEFYNGKLNLETLEMEKPKQEFKDGDIVYLNTKNGLQYVFAYDANKEMATSYIVAYCITLEEFAHIETQCICSDSMISRIHLATDSEKQQLFDALAKENKAWDAEKKMLVDLPKECEFQPFDKVLVRMKTKDTWQIELFSHLSKDEDTPPYHCIYGYWKYCIPYNDQTAHLLGTTDEWEGGNNE